ncbi:UDP-N-acetylmuramoyl-tripeptide--D-alanyl-D-alanine ligase [Sphingopyxis panaciterrulae]|uniref:UDP-N-acetylmuramoyl-tripeptide--D-alanyl-D-alanine ligase n=1 Tax=Sphingopyxis panaciterrulae TaxID=462372 RepID=A0A7W9B7I6_9SPHN|nr:UDP-N-acetylmuramoyl-tripeptide--D-alanyl-D-alanine ligase [Sphingopyxis panaciterrulae]MBB5707658.1 UDP-N-acetylmuramoyl-tripeptide--D-alanyl-D-alanine ligase [Sphingopyxis panaciterrulae]
MPDIAPVVTKGARRFVLFVAFTDATRRAEVFTVTGATAAEAWDRAAAELARREPKACWLRVDRVDAVERSSWGGLRSRLKEVKRNYFRLGISLDADFEHAFLETEINANAMLYGGPKQASAVLNEANFCIYAAQRHDLRGMHFVDERPIWLFTTKGAFVGEDGVVHALNGDGLDSGRRTIARLDPESISGLIRNGSDYLASQVGPDGRFHYGWHPCFDRPIQSYNSLRHASTLYAMLEAWEVIGDAVLKAAIDRALDHLVTLLIRTAALPNGEQAAFLVDAGSEIKLGGNAVSILALVKYRELTGDGRHAALLDGLASGIAHMQNPETGRFIHVLTYPALEVKQEFRIIYYEGEAAFALMRLFGLTGDVRWLAAVEKAFGHFIREQHWQAHDHWLSYCVNELTLHRPDEAYFRFGLDNFRDYLDFVLERITTFPTLLELMMAAEKMIARLRADPALAHLLDGVDVPRFYKALHHRAQYLLNGHFWPELAMFFADPRKIAGSFFIRHHAFRVRIDDVEHYLSGLIAYRNYLLACEVGGGFAHEEGAASAAPLHWTEDDVVKATGGRWADPLLHGWSASGLCMHPPTMRDGDMVALRPAGGTRGVPAAALARLPCPPAAFIAAAGDDAAKGLAPRLIVDDVGHAVLALGAYARERMASKVLAVTGSAGKTTTVAMLAHALASYGAVGQTRHTANLPHGIAWNLASIAWDVPHVVLELAIGRMAQNARLARPDIAVFTNILPAHLEYHGDLATIAARKSRIFEGMERGSVAVLNRDMAEWERVHMAARLRGLSILHYGKSEGCDFQLLAYDPDSRQVSALIQGRKIRYFLTAAGDHMALNSLAVLAAVAATGGDIQRAIASFAEFSPVAGRGEQCELSFGVRRITLIDDAYNANPGSMAAALALLGSTGRGRRKIAVLGEMRELGPDAITYHTALAPLIAAYGIDRVHAVGELYEGFWRSIADERRGRRTASIEELRAGLMSELRDGDVLLLKGSHGTLMYEFVDWLKSEAAPAVEQRQAAHAF